MKTLLEVRDLVTEFRTADRGVVRAVDGISFDILEGETVCLVGESGCGKSVTSLSLLRLIPEPGGKIAGGQILFEGKDLLHLPMSEMRKIRGNEISMVFQEPMTSLNPVFTIGQQIMEAIEIHSNDSKKIIRDRTMEMLKLVGISSPEKRFDYFPHQLSGGMRQRVMIAMALSCSPKLLIADEPTTALDVTIQAQILDLLRSLKEKLRMSLLLITHDLGVVAETADRVAVMYAGKIIEKAPVKELFKNPQHPYTQGLLNSMPKRGQSSERLTAIPGMVPNLWELPDGCRFQERCSLVMDRCRDHQPSPVQVGDQHIANCFARGVLK